MCQIPKMFLFKKMETEINKSVNKVMRDEGSTLRDAVVSEESNLEDNEEERRQSRRRKRVEREGEERE